MSIEEKIEDLLNNLSYIKVSNKIKASMILAEVEKYKIEKFQKEDEKREEQK